MTSEQKYKQLGADYHWQWARAGDSNPYVRWVKRVLASLPDEVYHGYSVLDVGCGDGYPASLLVAKGYQVLGVDVYEPALDVAREKVQSPVAHFERVSDTVPVCDYVLAFEAIEHMDSTDWLVEAVKACREYALITSPAPGHDPYAVRDYTLDELIALFEGCAVEVLIDEGEHRLIKVTPVEPSTLPVMDPENEPAPTPKRTKRAHRRTE